MTADTYASEDSAPQHPKKVDLTPRQKLIVGGLGGMTPIIATLMVGEHELLPPVQDPTAANFYIGLGLRSTLFFLVGAVFVWLHTEVRTRYAVFRLGVTAPALIAAMMGAAPAQATAPQATGQAAAAEVRVAALQVPNGSVMSDALPPDVVLQRKCSVWDGFFGRKCKRR